MGRFLQTDPIRYGDGANIYAYVHGDPVNGTDPTGLDDFSVSEVVVTAGNIFHSALEEIAAFKDRTLTPIDETLDRFVFGQETQQCTVSRARLFNDAENIKKIANSLGKAALPFEGGGALGSIVGIITENPQIEARGVTAVRAGAALATLSGATLLYGEVLEDIAKGNSSTALVDIALDKVADVFSGALEKASGSKDASDFVGQKLGDALKSLKGDRSDKESKCSG